MDTQIPPKAGFKLTSLHTLVATLAGIISIMGGLYSLKSTVFQTQPQGIVQGMVRDQAIAKPLREATVEISDIGNFILSTLYTDSAGHYQTGKLKEGPYIIKVTAVRHLPQTKTVTVLRDQTSTVNFDLTTQEDENKPLSPAASEPSIVPVVQPAYVPSAPFSEPVYKPASNPRMPYSGGAEPRYRPPQYRNSTAPAYEPAQRPVSQPTMAQSLVQTSIQLLGNYTANKNKSQAASETNQTDQNENSDSDNQNSYY